MQERSTIADPNARFTRADLEYHLPGGLIAQHPPAERDASRMLVLDRAGGALLDRGIHDLPAWLRPGDLLVLNDTRVLPAKFVACRDSGGKVEGLFEQETRRGQWRVMLRGSRRLRTGERLDVGANRTDSIRMHLLEGLGMGRWLVSVEAEGTAEELLQRVGWTPLPPYIHRDQGDRNQDEADRCRYQTVYARRPGAIAAPTAGLHLTEALLARLHEAGIDTAFVTLHVGAGTFSPVRVSDLSEHEMHAEWYEVTRDAAAAVGRCRERDGRVVAVGTTTVRVLETAVDTAENARTVRAGSGLASLFIYPASRTAPPERFRVVDALLTNFHLPGSTLLALVMAFAGVRAVRRAYEHAIARAYRFYSYGDAMLIV